MLTVPRPTLPVVRSCQPSERESAPLSRRSSPELSDWPHPNEPLPCENEPPAAVTLLPPAPWLLKICTMPANAETP